MVKAFHKNLKGKMKIIKKLHPIGNEFKTLCGPRPKMVFYMRLYENKKVILKKDYMNEVGTTTRYCLQSTKSWKGIFRIVIGNSLFGSVTSIKS